MDYDASEIAATYDRARGHRPEVVLQWMDSISRLTTRRPAKILDLGCGTGRFSYALARHFCAEVLGIDPSEQMLAHARAKRAEGVAGSVRFELAAADAIPLPSDSVDLVFMSQIFHHLQNPQTVARRCDDVLIDSGVVFVRNTTIENLPSVRYGDFFPASVPLLHESLPSRAAVHSVFESAGFRLLARESFDQQLASDHVEYADKLSLRADSFLARLGAQEFEQGMANLRRYANGAGRNEPVHETVDFFLFAKGSLSAGGG